MAKAQKLPLVLERIFSLLRFSKSLAHNLSTRAALLFVEAIGLLI